MANEFQESFKAPVESTQNMAALGDYAMVRQDQQLAKFDRQMNADLVDSGILPAMELNLANGDDDVIELKNPFKKDITTKQMKDSGVKASETLEDDGRKTITGEYPSGVKVQSTEGKTITNDAGRTVTITGTDIVTVKEPIHETKKNSGVWVDGKGREVAKKNDDGSVTVSADDGSFYRQDSEGIKKVSAIRSRDGKTFEEIDTDTPLGNLRPPQIPVRK